jgi:hypothetical protein
MESELSFWPTLYVLTGTCGLLALMFWRGRRAQGTVVLTVSFFALAYVAGTPDQRSPAPTPIAPPPERAQPMAAPAPTDDQRAGFHCLSNWNGAHRDLNAAVVATLRDPDSFQHIETRITPMNPDGTHLLFMDYRARNGFGGMNIGHVAAVVQNSDCSFTVTVQTEE